MAGEEGSGARVIVVDRNACLPYTPFFAALTCVYSILRYGSIIGCALIIDRGYHAKAVDLEQVMYILYIVSVS